MVDSQLGGILEGEVYLLVDMANGERECAGLVRGQGQRAWTRNWQRGGVVVVLGM
jgi:hypothetical protein